MVSISDKHGMLQENLGKANELKKEEKEGFIMTA